MKIHLKKKLLACLISALSLSTQDIPNARAKLKFYNPVRLLNNYIFYKHKVAERSERNAKREKYEINDLFYDIKNFCDELKNKEKFTKYDLNEYLL